MHPPGVGSWQENGAVPVSYAADLSGRRLGCACNLLLKDSTKSYKNNVIIFKIKSESILKNCN